jgi:hypothetical protein
MVDRQNQPGGLATCAGESARGEDLRGKTRATPAQYPHTASKPVLCRRVAADRLIGNQEVARRRGARRGFKTTARPLIA